MAYFSFSSLISLAWMRCWAMACLFIMAQSVVKVRSTAGSSVSGSVLKVSLSGSTTSPFTAYFTSDYTPIAAGARLVIAMRGGFNRMEGDTDAIRLVSDSASDKADIYGINGVKVGKIDASNVREVIGSLPAGVYIINGKKYVK